MENFEQFSVKERTEIVELSSTTKSHTLVQRQLRSEYTGKKTLYYHAITRLTERFRNTGIAEHDEKPPSVKKTMVWCALVKNIIFGPYFF